MTAQPHPKGTLIKNEYAVEPDLDTGASVERITSGGGVNHTFFFLTPSFRPGHPGQLGFVTHRAGCPQVCLFDFSTKSALVVTDRLGLQPFSPTFSRDGNHLYFTTRDGVVCATELTGGKDIELLTMENASLGECALSADGRRMVVPFKRETKHGLVLLEPSSGEARIVFEGEMKLLHPQFHPCDPDLILFAGDPYPRLWMLNLRHDAPECLYENGPDEFIVHESFLGRSDNLIFAVWPRYLGKFNLRDRGIQTLARVNAWHMVSDPAGEWIISDTAHPDRGLLLIDPTTGAWTTVCHPNASCRGSQWEKDHPAGPEVWAALRDGGQGDLSWMEMKADHVYGPQTTHPHPAFDLEGCRVSFTSDRSGAPEVYVVDTSDFKAKLRESRTS